MSVSPLAATSLAGRRVPVTNPAGRAVAIAAAPAANGLATAPILAATSPPAPAPRSDAEIGSKGAGADAAGERTLSTMKTTARPMNFILKSSCLAVSCDTDLIRLPPVVI